MDLQQYIDAVDLVNDCVLTDDRSAWWPHVDRIERGMKVHVIDGKEFRSIGDVDGYSEALMRLMIGGDAMGCALFAYDVKLGIDVGADAIVGFLESPTSDLKPAWDGRCVFPRICFPFPQLCPPMGRWIHRIPPGTKWIVGACLNKRPRYVVGMYGQGRSPQEVLGVTPSIADRRRQLAGEK